MLNFDLFWALLGHFGGFPYSIGKINKMKNLHMTLEDVTKIWYFMTFILKSHILAKKVDFLTFFTHFGHFGGLPY